MCCDFAVLGVAVRGSNRKKRALAWGQSCLPPLGVQKVGGPESCKEKLPLNQKTGKVTKIKLQPKTGDRFFFSPPPLEQQSVKPSKLL